MSLRIRFFKLPKHSTYDYKPRYYDPQKEELEERLKRIEDLKGGDVDAAKARIAGGFKRGFSKDHNRFRRKQVAQSNYILLATMITLGILTIYLLSRYMPEMASFFGD